MFAFQYYNKWSEHCFHWLSLVSLSSMVNGIPNNLFYFFPRFPLSLSSPMYSATVPCISQNEAMIICNNISENQINIIQGQMRAALCTHRKKGQLLTNWFDVKERHSLSHSEKTLTVRRPITSPPRLQLQLPLTPNYVLNLHSNGPRYATFPSAPLCIWLSISL